MHHLKEPRRIHVPMTNKPDPRTNGRTCRTLYACQELKVFLRLLRPAQLRSQPLLSGKQSATRLNEFSLSKMSSAKATDMNSLSNGDLPVLPSNVFIFSQATSNAAKALLNGRIFTRLTVVADTEPSQLVEALRSKQQPEVDETFCLFHHNIILIFDSEGQDLEDAHHEHFRTVCLALKEKNINLDVAGCVFDAPTALQAGFQLEEMSSGSVLVIDIMSGDNGSDDDDQDSDGVGVQRFLVNEDVESTMS